MPPKRKQKEAADANADSAKKAKSATEDTSNLRPINKHEERWSKVSGSKNLDADYQTRMQDPKVAYEYKCICDPFREPEDEDEDEEDEEAGEATGETQRCDGGTKCACGKPTSELSDHPYIISTAGKARFFNAREMMDLRNPDAFSMHTFNDHMAYGALEVVQNLLLDFDEAFKANDWQEAWAVVEGMVLFMRIGGGDMMGMADDGELISRTCVQIARMVLTAFAGLEETGQLKTDSPMKNIG